MTRRRFGNIRQLKSGRWQVCYPGWDGTRRYAPHTFLSKTEAGNWLTALEADRLRGIPTVTSSHQSLGSYVQEWLDQHPTIGPRWKETCERNLHLHLAPLHDVRLCDLDPTTIRRWRADALKAGAGVTSIAQTYRFLRAALNTAVQEEVLTRNPCVIRGAGADHAPERPVADLAQLDRLIEGITPRFRAAVVLASWCGLRRGEILALRRNDIDLEAGTVTVNKNQVELLKTKEIFDAPPKTKAGYRTVAIPPHVIPLLQQHLDTYATADRVYANADGTPVRGGTLQQAFTRVREREGLEHLRFHDLRHTGQTLAAEAGASLADLMRRLGHASTAAAKRYLHATDARDRDLAAALSGLHQRALPSPPPPTTPAPSTERPVLRIVRNHDDEVRSA